MNRSDEPAPCRDGLTSSAATSRSLLDRVKADEPEAWDRLIALYAPKRVRGAYVARILAHDRGDSQRRMPAPSWK